MPPTGGLIFLLGALVAFGPLSIDLYLPALPAMAESLAASAEAVQLSVTVFLFGFSLGMLFYGPISDSFGRRRVMLAGIALFVVASLGCMLAQSVDQLVAARFLQALGGGAASVLARAVVRDVFAPAEAIRKLSLMAMVTAVAPLVAPVGGSLLLDVTGWRGTFALLVLWGIASLAVVWTRLPETLPAERRGGLTLGPAFRAYLHMALSPLAIGLVLAGAMSFAAMFAYITAGADFFIRAQGLSPTAYSLIFALNAVGIFLANYLNSRLTRTAGPVSVAGMGTAIGVAGALALVAVMQPASPSMAAVIAALFFVVSITGLLGANCVGLLMQYFPANAGAAAAFFGASQFGFGTLASYAVSHLHDGSGRPMAWVMLFCSLLSLAGYLLFRRCKP